MKKHALPYSKKNIIFSHFLKSFTLICIIITLSCSDHDKGQKSKDLPRSTPEAEGISSTAICDFLEAIEKTDHEFHSFMIVRHGKVVAEGWWNPYRKALKHTMYSTSKSFTSTAVGFAVSDSLLRVDDQVISFFPDDLPDTLSNFLKELTVKDLLIMSVGQKNERISTYTLQEENWPQHFLSLPFEVEPGTKFRYNSMATYMLSAIVQKVTGESVLEYLKPRLFDPLKITGIDWESDPKGISVGGWGLRLKTEDMAKFGQLLLQKGMWEGKQLLSKDWIEEATSKKIDQNPEADPDTIAQSDHLQGYCYQFWRSRNNSYRAAGAFGQYIMVLPEKDAVIAITGESHQANKELDLVWKYIYPAMTDTELEKNEEAYQKLLSKTESLMLEPASSLSQAENEEKMTGISCVFNINDSISEKYSFQFGEKICNLELSLPEGKIYTLSFGESKWIEGETDKPGPNLVPQPEKILKPLMPFVVAGSYHWEDSTTIICTLRYTESPHHEFYKFRFEDDSVYLTKGNSVSDEVQVNECKGQILK